MEKPIAIAKQLTLCTKYQHCLTENSGFNKCFFIIEPRDLTLIKQTNSKNHNEKPKNQKEKKILEVFRDHTQLTAVL